ncbi:alpha/beta hydrolase family protein [Lentzea nigeriaca]|uniref:alpha/beta hydrolase family protein n=1 Tax=Lentzea nigeriaca TaxID=1128665 RepID=UPI001EF89D19|nr:prolyl oligopeptidase family serine peptidase [Lentzea nigeriaca]MBM7864466.1 dienelactone hydrolase [Lentzea nigeriaca]
MQLLMAAVLAASTLVSPQLTGPFPVGTFDAHLTDSTRADPFQPAKNRELMVTVSYPARRTGTQAPWLGRGLAQAIDPIISSPDYLDIPAGSVDWSGTLRQARVDAPAVPGRWPVVLFSPGLQTPREFYAGAADDLASRGYVVVTVSHTHESAAVEFPGNRIEWGLVRDGKPETMKKAIDARVADMRFVLTELPRLHRWVDMDRVGIAGHSYGGYTAGETMVNDRRFDAGINIDGAMEHTGDGGTYAPGKVVKNGLDRPFLLFGGDRGDQELSHVDTSLTRTWADFWPNQRGWKRDVHLDNGAHSGFSDLQWSVPQIAQISPQRRAGLIGTIDPQEALNAQHDYVAAFFDLHLKHRATTLFDRPRHPGIRLVR